MSIYLLSSIVLANLVFALLNSSHASAKSWGNFSIFDRQHSIAYRIIFRSAASTSERDALLIFIYEITRKLFCKIKVAKTYWLDFLAPWVLGIATSGFLAAPSKLAQTYSILPFLA